VDGRGWKREVVRCAHVCGSVECAGQSRAGVSMRSLPLQAAVKAFGTQSDCQRLKRQAWLLAADFGGDCAAPKTNSHAPWPRKRASRSRALERGERPSSNFNVAARKGIDLRGVSSLDWQEYTDGAGESCVHSPWARRGDTLTQLPINLVAHKVAHAIAAGCSMVLKRPQTPVLADAR